MLLLGVALLALLWLALGGGGPGDGPSKPVGVPSAVWRWDTMARSVAKEVGLPYDHRWALAQIWQESSGDPSAKPPGGGDGEVGLMQVTPIALEDVRENFPNRDLPQTVGDMEGSPEMQIRVGMLYDSINYNRAQKQGIPNPKQAAIRSHVEGPPPNSSASNNYWNRVSSYYDALTK